MLICRPRPAPAGSRPGYAPCPRAHADATYAPDGAILPACCHGGSSDMQTSDSVRTWTVATGRPGDVLVGSSGAIGLSHDNVRGVVLYSPDGRQLIRVTSGESGFGGLSPGGSLKVWSLQERSKSQSYRLPGGNIYAAHTSRSGELRVTATNARLDCLQCQRRLFLGKSLLGSRRTTGNPRGQFCSGQNGGRLRRHGCRRGRL